MKTLKFAPTIILFFLSQVKLQAQCVTQGPQVASNFSNDGSVGTIGWLNPDNAQTSNNLRATAGTLVGIGNSVYSNYLVSTSFDFTIPNTATICGIVAQFERRQQGVLIGSSVRDYSLYIVKNGSLTGNQHAATGTNWPGTEAVALYGSSTDLWGTTWTPADINTDNFGVAISASLNAGLAALTLSAQIDQVTITVYYDNTLPVELTSFTALCENENVHVKWVTASEINCDYFTVQRSADGLEWESIHTIKGQGNSTQTNHYSYTDENIQSGNYFYRLEQIDFNGQKNIHDAVAVQSCSIGNAINLFPNPTNNEVQVEMVNQEYISEILVTDVSGRAVVAKSFTNTTQCQLDISALPAGVYMVHVYSDNTYSYKRLVKK